MSGIGGSYENIPENCGVEYDETCNDLEKANPENEPDLIQCAEGDEDCQERKRQSMASEGGAKSRQGSTDRSNPTIEGMDLEAWKNRLSIGSKSDLPEPRFEGLPSNYYMKYYRPDYPGELQMRTICAAPPSRANAGLLKSHPKVAFIPSDPSLATFQKRVSGVAEKPGPAKQLAVNFMNEPSPLMQNRLPPPIISGSDEIVVDWLQDHNIQMMFEYFLGLSVIHQPEDPWIFVSQLCAKMIEARQDIGAFDDLPRIISPEHTEAIFRIYDRIGNGFITASQYKSALEAMGLTRFSTSPNGWEENAITRETFVREATEAINYLLRSFMAYDDGGDLFPTPQEDKISTDAKGKGSEEGSDHTRKSRASNARKSRASRAKSPDGANRASTEDSQ